MRKIWIVAQREYKAMVATKTFLIGLLLMPMLMLGAIIVPTVLRDRVDLAEKRIVILGGEKDVFDGLMKVVENRNEKHTTDEETGKQNKPVFVVERFDGEITDQVRLEMSESVRRRDIEAFIEITEESVVLVGPKISIAYHSQGTVLSETQQFVTNMLRQIVRFNLYAKQKADVRVAMQADLVTIESKGLYKRSAAGEIVAPETDNDIVKVMVPFGTVMVMYMILVMSIQPMLDGVIEEKGLRIAEVLLGSLSPTQLMFGKLIGILGSSFTILSIYLIGAVGAALYHDVWDAVPIRVIPWFFIFEVLFVLFFGAIFLAVGSCVSQLKEAQGLLLPLWILISAPMFAMAIVLREPMGNLATTLSLIPPLIPMLMTLRIAVTEAVPIWQPCLAAIFMLLGACGVVFVAGRVFRIGILTQGNTPNISDLIRWAIRG